MNPKSTILYVQFAEEVHTLERPSIVKNVVTGFTLNVLESPTVMLVFKGKTFHFTVRNVEVVEPPQLVKSRKNHLDSSILLSELQTFRI